MLSERGSPIHRVRPDMHEELLAVENQRQIYVRYALHYGTAALEELWPLSNKGFFI